MATVDSGEDRLRDACRGENLDDLLEAMNHCEPTPELQLTVANSLALVPICGRRDVWTPIPDGFKTETVAHAFLKNAVDGDNVETFRAAANGLRDIHEAKIAGGGRTSVCTWIISCTRSLLQRGHGTRTLDPPVSMMWSMCEMAAPFPDFLIDRVKEAAHEDLIYMFIPLWGVCAKTMVETGQLSFLTLPSQHQILAAAMNDPATPKDAAREWFVKTYEEDIGTHPAFADVVTRALASLGADADTLMRVMDATPDGTAREVVGEFVTGHMNNPFSGKSVRDVLTSSAYSAAAVKTHLFFSSKLLAKEELRETVPPRLLQDILADFPMALQILLDVGVEDIIAEDIGLYTPFFGGEGTREVLQHFCNHPSLTRVLFTKRRRLAITE